MNQIEPVAPDSPKGLYNQIRILFLAITGGATLFLLVLFFLKGETDTDPNPELDQVFRFLVPAMVVGGIAVGMFIRNQQKSAVLEEHTLLEKLARFRSGLLIQLTASEAGALFAGVAALITGRALYLLEGLAAVIWMALQFPTIDVVAQWLNLGSSERDQL